MTHRDVLDFLATLPLFSVAHPSLLKEATESKSSRLITLAAGESPDTHFTDMLGVVLSGKLHILSSDTERPVILKSISRGHVFGAASLFLEGRAPVSRLLAKSDCSLFFLSRDTVRDLLCADHAFMDAYLRFLAERVHFLNKKIRSFTAGSSERRLALWLTEHAQEGVVRAFSLSALADTLDIGRASLYRALDKMEAEGLIMRNGREISLLSTESLLQKYHS